jgi:mitochondrial fission protein ELM1
MTPLVWAFVSDHPGDNAQVLALAEELGLPFEIKPLYYTWRKRLPGSLERASLFTLDPRSRAEQIVPQWPDLIIMVGPRPQPIGRHVKRLSGGRTKLVLIGRPRAPVTEFDLVFDTRQYLLPDAPNVRLLPLLMSRYRAPLEPTDEERAWLAELARPHLLLMIGGPIRYWNVTPAHTAGLVQQLLARATRLGGSLIVAGSPRTPRAVLDRARHELASIPNGRFVEELPRFQVLMDDADELFPTGDSVSMTSESVITGRPVGIAPVEQTLWGRVALGPESRMEWSRFRDLRRFWNYLRDKRLAGTIDEPVAGTVLNPVVTAAEQVRELLRISD